MVKKIVIALIVALSSLSTQELRAQHTLGFTAGYGMANARFEPPQDMRAIWGSYNAGFTWRYYGEQRFVGGFGIDLEFIQQGYSYATNSSQVEEKSDYLYYTRNVNTLMLPIVWQPHFYMLKNRLRVYFEAAATFSYHLNSTYDNAQAAQAGLPDAEGDYEFKLARDNRFGYGLAGGGGVAILIKQYELNFRARYYFGLSDIIRNKNRYSGNDIDGPENPFYTTPQRSPMDNISISVGLSYRFNKEGFQTWKPRAKRAKSDK